MGASARPPSPYSRVEDEHHERRPYSRVPDQDGPRLFVDGFRVDAHLAHPPARSSSPHLHAEVPLLLFFYPPVIHKSLSLKYEPSSEPLHMVKAHRLVNHSTAGALAPSGAARRAREGRAGKLVKPKLVKPRNCSDRLQGCTVESVELRGGVAA